MIDSVPALPEGWSIDGDELRFDGEIVGTVRQRDERWELSVVNAEPLRALAPEADVEGQGVARTIIIGAIAFAVTFSNVARADEGSPRASYALVHDVNPKVHAHRAAPVLADRTAIVGKTIIVVVRNTETEAHGDMPLVVDRVEEREGRLVYVGHVVAPPANLPADMQRQLRKDWYPAPGTTFEVHASDVRDLLELRTADLR